MSGEVYEPCMQQTFAQRIGRRVQKHLCIVHVDNAAGMHEGRHVGEADKDATARAKRQVDQFPQLATDDVHILLGDAIEHKVSYALARAQQGDVKAAPQVASRTQALVPLNKDLLGYTSRAGNRTAQKPSVDKYFTRRTYTHFPELSLLFCRESD
jgi:hypothetical protein